MTAEELEQRIHAYHATTIAEVVEMLDYLRDPQDCIIAGGSLTLGLGNEKSDLDVVVTGPNTSGSGRVPLEHWLKTLRIDAWKLNTSTIDELFGSAERALSREEPFQGTFGDVEQQADFKLLHRVAFGVLLDGQPLEPSTTRAYDEIARDLLVREYAERMRESAFVAQMATISGRAIAASTHARMAVEEALHSVLAARGVPFTGDKWLVERLAQKAPALASLHSEYALLPDARDDARGFVAGAVEACERLTGVDLAIGTLAGRCRWENTDLKLFQVGDQQLLLTAEHGGLWELDEAEVRAWEGLGGAGSLPCEDCDDEQRKLCFDLYSQGLMNLRWTRGIPISELAAVQAVQT